MSDYSLMNPDHLKSEIRDLEEELVTAKQFADDVHTDAERIFGHIASQYDEKENDTIVLTREQALDLIQTLSRIDLYRWRFFKGCEFQIRVYKHLMKDRRWFIAAKYLRFLKK